MKELITVKNGEIRLNSTLDEFSFGKTDFDSIITEQGLVVIGKKNNGNYDFSFSKYSFEEIKTLDDDYFKKVLVFYCGKSSVFSENAKTFHQICNDALKEGASKEEEDLFFNSGFALISLITQIAKENIEFSPIGSGGILMEFDDDGSIRIFFAPSSLYKYSTAGLSENETAEMNDCWMNLTLKDLPSLCFYRSVIAYKMITGSFPYPEAKTIERNADILDQKFLPLQYCINGIDKELADSIERGLKLNSNVVNIPGKKRKGHRSEDLRPKVEFPLQNLHDFYSNYKKPDSEDPTFIEKRDAFIKAQNKKIKTRRLFRRNKPALVVILCAIVSVILITTNTIKTNGKNYTSLGLTSEQTIQGFFWGFNTKDTILLDDFSKGKSTQNLSDVVSQMYVIGKQRQTYNHDQGFPNLEGWLLWSTDAEKASQAGCFGITNLEIDGKRTPDDLAMYKKNEKPAPLTEEKGIILKNGDKSIHEIHYYLVHSEGETYDIEVDSVTATVTLTYMKNKWIMTDFNSTSQKVDVDSEKFKDDYYSAFIQFGDVVQAAKSLQIRYQWLPNSSAIESERKRQIDYESDLFSSEFYRTADSEEQQ